MAKPARMTQHAQEKSSTAFLEFTAVKKTYDHKDFVVKDFNLTVQQGEFITLLGPSGSGKTTVLMMLAGFEHLSSGQIHLNGVPIDPIAPYKRNIGMVFQNYALFPHLTVAENLAYPLRVRRWSKKRIEKQINHFLQLIDLAGFKQRYPQQLSGGQRQRVALARALIYEPPLVLMDEPLGALDKNLREHMQYEIKRLHQTLGCTVIYVTHDQSEALTLSDKIAVFNQGKVQQFAPPKTLYENPQNAFVATFIGENNLLPVPIRQVDKQRVIASLDDTTSLILRNGDCLVDQTTQGWASIRPEKIQINPQAPMDNLVEAQLQGQQYVGDFTRYFFRTPSGHNLTVKQPAQDQNLSLSADRKTWLGWQANDGIAFEPHEALAWPA